MARAAKATTTTKPTSRGRKPGRPAVVAQKKTPAKAAKAAAAAPKRAANAAPAAPKLSKDELRALTEKLSDARSLRRQAKTLYPQHRHISEPHWAYPRDRSSDC